MIRSLLTGSAATGGAYMANDQFAEQYTRQLVRGTGIDPQVIEYAQQGLDPVWGFVVVLTAATAKPMAEAAKTWAQDRSADKSRRVAAELGEMIEDKK